MVVTLGTDVQPMQSKEREKVLTSRQAVRWRAVWWWRWDKSGCGAVGGGGMYPHRDKGVIANLLLHVSENKIKQARNESQKHTPAVGWIFGLGCQSAVLTGCPDSSGWSE